MSDLSTSEVGGDSVDIIKVEKQFCSDMGELDNKVDVIKLEQFYGDSKNANEAVDNDNESFMEMVDHKVKNEHQVTSKNMLASEEESNKLVSIKKEELCGEDETRPKEGNLVEFEDQKCLLNDEIEIKIEEPDFSRFADAVVPYPEIATSLRGSSKCLMPNDEEDPSKAYIIQTLTNENGSTVTMYQCEYCSFQTKNKYYLKSHLLKHKDPPDIKMYRCNSCSFQTKYNQDLKKHLLVHTDPSEAIMYKCDSCSFLTKYKAYLRIHLLTHRDPLEVTMYKCETCPYQTIQKCNLKIHMLKHKDPSEVTIYKCDYCSYQTKHECGLKMHVLKHKNPSEVTMYKCDYCSYQAKRKGNLKMHLLKHKDPSEVTVYKCHSCSFQTKLKGSLRTHMLKSKVHRKVPMYDCDYCSYQTKHKFCLLKHHEIVHKVSEKSEHEGGLSACERKRTPT